MWQLKHLTVSQKKVHDLRNRDSRYLPTREEKHYFNEGILSLTIFFRTRYWEKSTCRMPSGHIL